MQTNGDRKPIVVSSNFFFFSYQWPSGTEIACCVKKVWCTGKFQPLFPPLFPIIRDPFHFASPHPPASHSRRVLTLLEGGWATRPTNRLCIYCILDCSVFLTARSDGLGKWIGSEGDCLSTVHLVMMRKGTYGSRHQYKEEGRERAISMNIINVDTEIRQFEAMKVWKVCPYISCMPSFINQIPGKVKIYAQEYLRRKKKCYKGYNYIETSHKSCSLRPIRIWINNTYKNI